MQTRPTGLRESGDAALKMHCKRKAFCFGVYFLDTPFCQSTTHVMNVCTVAMKDERQIKYAYAQQHDQRSPKPVA